MFYLYLQVSFVAALSSIFQGINKFLCWYQIIFQNLDSTSPDVEQVKEGEIHKKTQERGIADPPESAKDEVSLSPLWLQYVILLSKSTWSFDYFHW